MSVVLKILAIGLIFALFGAFTGDNHQTIILMSFVFGCWAAITIIYIEPRIGRKVEMLFGITLKPIGVRTMKIYPENKWYLAPIVLIAYTIPLAVVFLGLPLAVWFLVIVVAPA